MRCGEDALINCFYMFLEGSAGALLVLVVIAAVDFQVMMQCSQKKEEVGVSHSILYFPGRG